MHVIFVHGWSVRNTDTYGVLPQYLKQLSGQNFTVDEIFLGKYVSFEDTVTMRDLSRAFEHALRDQFGAAYGTEKFACITHSTGGPVVRRWVHDFYRTTLATCPMTHLVMLAPANHGSALAQLGKGRLSRMQKFFDGVEPGQRVLDWLELGSDESWELNTAWFDYDCVAQGLYPFVLTGHTIDRKMYDALNSYTDEKGSDGVVRIAAANMNYTLLSLEQNGGKLEPFAPARRTPATVLAVLPGVSHSGEDKGILRGMTLAGAPRHPTVKWLLKCLSVADAAAYASLVTEAQQFTAQTLEAEKEDEQRVLLFKRKFDRPQCAMLVFRIRDDVGDHLTQFEMRLTAGSDYKDQALPAGFFVDRQQNQRNRAKLTYYLNYDALRSTDAQRKTKDCYGFDIQAFPKSGLGHYDLARFQSKGDLIRNLLRANETLMVDVRLVRQVDAGVFQLSTKMPPEDISKEPLGVPLPPL